jgi:hypothetical protein
MKDILKFGAIMIALTLAVSCGEDEPELDPIVGVWVLDEASYTNLPTGYQDLWEGVAYSSFYGETRYELTFEENKYIRSLTFNLIGGGDTIVSEEGEWVNDGEFLTLDPTGGGLSQLLGVEFDNDFEIEINDGSDLVINAEITDFLYADTTTQAYFDYVWSLADPTSENLDSALWETKINELYKPVVFDLQYDFDAVN